MRAGTRASAAPFAQKTAVGTFEGFSVDLLHEFRAAAEKTVGRPVRLELFEVTPADRLQRVAAQELDIVCGITTPTWDREELVDFSLPFFRDGTRVMIYRKQASRGLDLNQLTVGVVEGTTTIGILKDTAPAAGACGSGPGSRRGAQPWAWSLRARARRRRRSTRSGSTCGCGSEEGEMETAMSVRTSPRLRGDGMEHRGHRSVQKRRRLWAMAARYWRDSVTLLPVVLLPAVKRAGDHEARETHSRFLGRPRTTARHRPRRSRRACRPLSTGPLPPAGRSQGRSGEPRACRPPTSGRVTQSTRIPGPRFQCTPHRASRTESRDAAEYSRHSTVQ